MAKINIHMIDLTPTRYSLEAEHNRLLAVHFIFSPEFVLWCEDAGVDDATARKRAQEILDGKPVKIGLAHHQSRALHWKRKIRELTLRNKDK